MQDIVDRGYVIIGSPDEVAEQLTEVATELNVGHLMLLLQFGNMGKDLTKYNTKLFAEKVMPKLKPLFAEWEDRWWPQPMDPPNGRRCRRSFLVSRRSRPFGGRARRLGASACGRSVACGCGNGAGAAAVRRPEAGGAHGAAACSPANAARAILWSVAPRLARVPILPASFGARPARWHGFHYSAGFASADFVWDDAHLDAWLSNPQN